jgi:methionyl-tRNA formyltransferase
VLDAGHEVALVLTQPDRPAGRGLKPGPSAVKRLAVDRELGLFQPEKLRDLGPIAAARPDILVVAAYGLLLPAPLLELAPRGAVNIHASLLPRWRGAAPVQRALLAGDPETGVTIMQMDAGLDTGPIISQHRVPVAPDDDAGSLHDKLAAAGADALLSALAEIEAGLARPRPQSAQGVTYAAKIDKRDTRLDWTRPAAELERAVRAFRPMPGAFALLEGEPLKVWRARVVDAQGHPGAVVDAQSELVVACAHQALAISELQRAGGRRLDAARFLRGNPLARGARLA